ncbi:MAG: ABC transporter ATP-binding protein [bacterium]|nr:ABC transporter ATP-binding protein [bacterium]
MLNTYFEDEKVTGKEKDIPTRKAFLHLLPLLKEHRGRLFFSLLLLAAATGLSLVWPVLLKDGIDGPLKENDFNALLILAWWIAGIQIVTVVIQYIMRVWLEIIGQDVMIELKERLFKHILSLDISFFDRNPVGRLMARVESDTESLRLLFTNTVVLIVADMLLLVGLYGVLFWYNWRMAAVLVLSIPVIGILVWIFHKITTHRFLEVRKRMAEVTATLTEFLHGMSIVQVFHRGDYARGRVFKVNESKFSEDAYVNIAVCLFFNTVFFFEYVKIGLVLILGPAFGMTFGLMIMFLLYIWRSFEPIFRTSEQLSNFQKAVAGAKRIFALLDEKPKLMDPVRPLPWPGLKKSIRFENVWFSYNDDENWVMRDVSFELQVGTSLALVGVTGGGKSTVISLLLRLYDPQEGRITVDGIDIREMAVADLRSHFALVLQDIILFPGDIISNIGLDAAEVTDARIRAAAKTVEADRFIERLPDGYQTEVSEKGSNFSRGERQLLSFARALAVDPDILILDEATSSVDPDTERQIQNSLDTLMEGRTSLVVAHRLATILNANQILVIRRGEIIERGTHTELILQSGYYSRLFHLQFKHKNGVAANA